MKQHTFWIACALLSASAAHAQSAGSWQLQLGMTRISPNVSSGTLSAPFPADTRTDVGSDSRPTAQITYTIDDHWSVALPLGTGFKHKLYGAGTGGQGVGQIGTTSVLPVTVFGRYSLGQPQAQIRPYLMMGLTYARFYDSEGSATLDALNPANPVGGHTGLKVSSRFAISPGLGMSIQLNERWFIDASYSRSLLKTTTKLSSGQTIDTRLNPDVVQFGLGYRF